MTTTPPNNHDDELENLLSQGTAMTIDDDGFTNRVLAKLPSKKRKTPRAHVLLVAAGLGSGVAVTSSPHIAALFRSAMQNWFAALVLFCVVVVLVGASTQEAWAER
jgi:hypothetical protein